jgi:TRAP-type C4-dicarboxylate transport system permease small subunit
MLGRILDFLDKILTWFEHWVLFISVMAGLGSLFANVVLRYGFNYSLAWSEELIREIIIITTFVGCSTAIKNRNQIVIDALPQTIPRFKIPCLLINLTASLFFSVVIFVLGWQSAALQAQTAQKTIIMEIPLEILFATLPLMGALMFIRTLQSLYNEVTTRYFPKKGAA